MSEAAVGNKELVRLLRHIAGHGALMLERAVGGVSIRRDGGQARQFPHATVEHAGALGLVIATETTIKATPEALAFLRRAMVAPEEAFQEQHRLSESTTTTIDGIRQPVRVNRLESPLGGLARLKEKSGQPFMPPEAIAAGERLHADFTRGQLQPRLTMTYEPLLSSKTRGGAGGIADLCDTAIAARGRVARAMEAVGPELCGVALDVCCFEKGLELVERERQWPARSAKLMLRTALMALSRHYAPPRTADRRSHAWGAEGYRPEIL